MNNMSEEEIIKNIKEMIQWSDHNTYKIALQGILDLYEQEKEKNKKYEISDYETICLENKHLLEQLEICQADLEEMTISNNYKKENWIHKDTLNSYILKSKLEEILDRYAYTKLDDEEKIIRFYKELQELVEERN